MLMWSPQYTPLESTCTTTIALNYVKCNFGREQKNGRQIISLQSVNYKFHKFLRKKKKRWLHFMNIAYIWVANHILPYHSSSVMALQILVDCLNIYNPLLGEYFTNL